MKHFIVTLIYDSERVVRNVIAPTAMQAHPIGASMMPDVARQFAIICKPARGM